jgi:hypothetical protein
MKKADRRMIRGIAVFKLAKAALLILVGVAALRLVRACWRSGCRGLGLDRGAGTWGAC